MSYEDGARGGTHRVCVLCATLGLLARVVELVYVLEEDDPADPTARGVKEGFYGALDGVEELDAGLDALGDVAPDEGDDAADDCGDEVDDEGEPPGDEEVGCGPEEPGLDVVEDVAAVVCGVGLVPEEVDEDGAGDEEGGEEGGADEGAEEEGDDAVGGG